MIETKQERTHQKLFLQGGECTLNNTGYMTGSLDPYSKAFVEYASQLSAPVVDIGACYGVAAIPALKKGAHVVAVDNDQRHLDELYSRASETDQQRLTLILGALPDQLSFTRDSMGAILCCRVLHLLRPDAIDISLQHFYEWLKVGGRLYIINDTPYAHYSDKLLEEFTPLYEQKKQKNILWPGYVPNLKYYLQEPFHPFSPDFVTLIGPDELVQACERIGFHIIKSGYISRPDYPPALQNDGRENAGVIAEKMKE